MEKIINILVTLDKNYLGPLGIMLKSLGEKNKDLHFKIYVAHSSLTLDDFKYLLDLLKDYKMEIINTKVEENYFEGIPILERIPVESFFRLLAFNFLPEDVEKILYLDPDILINNSVEQLYDLDITDKYVAACGHTYGLLNFFAKLRLGLTNQKHYFNSGVMLMNLKKIREDFSLDDVLDSLEINKQRLIMGDQDLANIIFGSNMLLIDEKLYNLDEKTYNHYYKKKQIDLDFVKKETVVIHYNGKYKPWVKEYKGCLDTFYPEVKEKKEPTKHLFKKQVKSIYNIMRPTKQQKVLIFSILSVIVLALVLLLSLGDKLLNVFKDPASFRTWLDNFGPFDEIIFIILRSIQTGFKFLPGSLVEVMAGYGWGIGPGILYCLIGNMLGTGLIFLLSKKFGRKLLDIFIPVSSLKSFEVFKNNKQIYLLLFLFYLIPGTPKDLIIYFIALLPINFFKFLLVSSLGRIPSMFLTTYTGTSLADKNYVVAVVMVIIIISTAIIGTLIYKSFIKKQKSKK